MHRYSCAACSLKWISVKFRRVHPPLNVVVDFRITSKSRNHLEKGFELCYNTIKPTRAITMYPKRDLSPLIRF